jgi:hypothetical protein
MHLKKNARILSYIYLKLMKKCIKNTIKTDNYSLLCDNKKYTLILYFFFQYTTVFFGGICAEEKKISFQFA